MIVVHDSYAASEVQMEDVTGEVIWTKLDLSNNNPLYLCSFYRTPADHNTAQLLELEESLEHINNMTRNNPNATIIFGGDFNAGDINLETNSVPSGAKQSTICSKVLDILSLFGLIQFRTYFRIGIEMYILTLQQPVNKQLNPIDKIMMQLTIWCFIFFLCKTLKQPF